MASPDFTVVNGNVGVGESEKLSRLTLKGKPSFSLSGTVAKSSASTSVSGTGTAFLTELGLGDRLVIPGGGGSESRVVVAIASDTALTVDTEFENSASGQTATAFPSILRISESSGTVSVLVSDQGFLALGMPPTMAIAVEDGVLGIGATGAADDEGAVFNYLEVSANSIRLQNGIRYESVVPIDANTTLDEGDFAVLVDAGSMGVTVTLPPVEDGRVYWVYKVAGAANVTVAPDGSDLINGANSSKTISTQWAALYLLGNESVGWTAVSLTGA